MTDDAPANGTPDQPAQPAQPGLPDDGPRPDRTVQRPRDPQPPGAEPVPPAVPPATPPTAVVPAVPAEPAEPGSGADAPGPGGPVVVTTAGRAGPTGALAAIGAGLLGAAVVISRVRTRADGELDWSNYGVGLGATAVLLLITVLAMASAGRREGSRARAELVTWPGVVGILGVALMIDVGLPGRGEWVGYLIGAVIVVLAALGYAGARRAAFAATAVVGLAILYALAFGDLIGKNLGEDDAQVVVAAAVGVFVLAVTVVGWLLPSRVVTGVAVGAAGLTIYAGMLVAMLVLRLLGQFLGGLFGGGPGGLGGLGGGPDEESSTSLAIAVGTDFRESDVWWIVAFTGILAVVWAVAAIVSNHSGFAILAVAAPVAVAPLASAVLAVEHPTWWSAVLAAAGGVLLLGGVVLARRRGRALTRPAY